MKKSILLATTALISAFALEARAGATPVTATFSTKVNVVSSLSAEAIGTLNFGTIQRPSGSSSVTVSVDASGNAGGTAVRYIEPEAGVIKITHSGSLDSTNPISLAFSNITPLKDEEDGVCGTIDPTTFVQGALTHVDHDDYTISFGATLTVTSSSPFKACSGTGVATLIRNVD